PKIALPARVSLPFHGPKHTLGPGWKNPAKPPKPAPYDETPTTKPLRRVPQPLRLRQRLQLLQRVVLDLADPFAGDVERPAHLFQRVRALAGQAEAHLDHLALA